MSISLKQVVIALSLSTLVLYGGLLVSAVYFFEVDTFVALSMDNRIWHAVGTSVLAASLATLLALLVAVPAGYALSRYRFLFKNVVDLLLELPVIVSPAAIGALLLIFFQTPLGLAIRDNVIDVVYAFSGIVLAQLVTVLGLATRMVRTVFDEIPPRYEAIGRTLGANHRQAFFRITLPMARNGILYAIILTWAKAIGEFGATITLAGAMQMRTETLPTAIFMRLSTADIQGTVIIIFLLFAISMVVLVGARLFLTSKQETW